MSHTNRSRGYSLIELLVVIAILAVLVGLLLPAIQKSREAANRTKCQGNLKQIALACHMYEGATGRFPATCPKDTTQSWAWVLLPNLGEQNLFDEWPSDTPIYDYTKESALATPIPTYFCPSRRSPESTPLLISVAFPQPSESCRTHKAKLYKTLAPTVSLSTPTAVGDYAAAIGTTGSDAPLAETVWGEKVVVPPSGAFVREIGVRAADITDGLSNTLLLGEKHVPVGFDLQSPYDCSLYDGHNPQCSTRSAGPGFPLAQGPGDPRIVFGGPHVGLSQFALADGSVRPVRTSIDEFTLGLLSQRNDGLPTPSDY